MKKLVILLIRAYQLCLSPYLGKNCRFYPTCSSYAIEAVTRYGVWAGGILTIKRLCKCHPWHPGGVDPVPTSSSSSSTVHDHCSHS